MAIFSSVDHDSVRHKAIVAIGSKLRVSEADLVGLLHLVAFRASVGAFDGTAVVVKSAMLSALLWIRLEPAHGAPWSASVLVGGVLLILEAHVCGRLSRFVAIRALGASLESATILVSLTMRTAF